VRRCWQDMRQNQGPIQLGWRAHQWHNFCQSGTRAAAALGHMAWTDVAARAKAAAAQWRQQ
ncbi:unnamed protein product, partial [Effrenium voratum]